MTSRCFAAIVEPGSTFLLHFQIDKFRFTSISPVRLFSVSVYSCELRHLLARVYFHINSLGVHTALTAVTHENTITDSLFTAWAQKNALITITCYAVCTDNVSLARNTKRAPLSKPQLSPLYNPISLSIFSLIVLASFYLIKCRSSWCLCGVIKVSEAGFNCGWIGLLWLMKPLVWAACTI